MSLTYSLWYFRWTYICIFMYIQAVVAVNDNGTPQRSAARNAFVTINVLRNQYTPFFINEPYRVDLGSNIGISTSIIDVTARDLDSPVSATFMFFMKLPPWGIILNFKICFNYLIYIYISVHTIWTNHLRHHWRRFRPQLLLNKSGHWTNQHCPLPDRTKHRGI